jgi:hypothetical protein
MRKVLWLACIVGCLAGLGCLDDLRRGHQGMTRTAVSDRARQVESDLDWDSL